MTEPADRDSDRDSDRDFGRDFGRDAGASAEPGSAEAFDPYRFGRPEHPVPPEYAPPGYVAPPAPPRAVPYPPYGPPPPGAPPWAPSPGNATGKATASLVLGIASIVLCWLTVFDIVPIVLAVVFGFLALGEARRQGRPRPGTALAGIVCAAIGAVLAIALTVVVVHAADKCGGLHAQRDRGFNHCIQDQF